MARRRKHRRGHSYSSLLGMNPPEAVSGAQGVLAGVQPKNLVGVVPVVGGVIANGMLTKFAADKIPVDFVKHGWGNYLLGLVSAGVIGAAAGRINKKVGHGMFIGGVVETLSRLVSDVSNKGFSALSGIETDPGAALIGPTMSGVGDFVTPMQVEQARPIDSQAGQYPLPAPMMAHAAAAHPATQAHYEAAVLSEVIDDRTGMEYGV